MGNTSSSSTSPKVSKDPKCATKPRRWRLGRKRATAALLSCLDAHLYDDQEAVSTDEKWNEKFHHRRQLSNDSTNSSSPLTPLTLSTPPSPPPSPPVLTEEKLDENRAFQSFINEYPQYQLTWILDTLRRTDYMRLDGSGETYVDYMGGAIYPESLVRVHSQMLNGAVLGNTHSISNSSQLSARYADEARQTVLSFFNAPSDEYVVIFTPNASGALKLVGESFPFGRGGSYVLGVDSHNSVHGIRQFASGKGATVAYIPSLAQGGMDVNVAKGILNANRPHVPALTPALFALTAQSNISNSKNSLSLLSHAKSLGFCTLLDAAALAPTSLISLKQTPVDAMAVSFYKMFGYPTGIGALVLRKSFAEEFLQRPWFAGGNVDVVQVPGTIVTRAEKLEEQFEDGTINYLMLPAVTDGLRFLSAYLPFLPLRLSSLMQYAVSSLTPLRYPETSQPVVKILSRPPTRRLRHVGEQSDAGSTLSMVFLDPNGVMLPLSFVSYCAHTLSISLRTGCMCNPGGSAALLGIESDMEQLYSGVRLRDFERFVGRELGVVRISLGLASNWRDVWKILQFANKFADSQWRDRMWAEWTHQRLSISSFTSDAM